ncbi:Methyltransferase domain-containing protein [Pedobacter westerhofensis]|uniref:Methyltransferase domain-containing protein n=1 Tax=Pedobacter westerhofensis TaxID=425512 RepID=A0A521FPX0_9SPHI|nr:class I SAM-dependent methyltransferase [Pedobacter westerhofensis]SMO98275.1 Methyltransferase domain-containing protein [Pedobacter westerhofensis]
MFQEDSYNKHSAWYNTHFPTEELKKDYFQKFKGSDQNTINNWLQKILFSCVDPLLSASVASWLTVGDAYGLDAHYICNNSSDHSAHASDLNSDFLEVSQKEGFVNSYSAENAEKLSFENNSFDYVLCKESYHHFPRPYMAVYEMLRVAKKGVVIIEPQDPISKMPALLFMKNILSAIGDKTAGKIWKNRFSYEPVGNFVYKVSEREFEKLAAGINLPFVAFKKINPNFYFKGAETAPAKSSNPQFRKLKFRKSIFDTLVKLGLICSQALGTIIYKEMPSEEEILQLEAAGFHTVKIPANPYL